LERVRAATKTNAVREIAQLIADLAASGLGARLAVTSDTPGRRAPTLDAILASHSLMHAEEGRFYRDVVAGACEAVGLAVRRVLERQLADDVAAKLGVDAAEVAERLREMGSRIGPPWSEDQKLATLAAWLCL
jgi:hypothetical protein